MKTSIKVSGKLVDNLRLLKSDTGCTTYEELLDNLVTKELRKYNAYTKEGYAPIGAVVKDGDKVLIISNIESEKVIFNDGTYAFNGGSAVWRLKILAKSLEEYGEDRVDV